MRAPSFRRSIGSAITHCGSWRCADLAATLLMRALVVGFVFFAALGWPVLAMGQRQLRHEPELARRIDLEIVDVATRSQLEQARQMAQREEWGEAIRLFFSVGETATDRLVAVDLDQPERFVRFIPLKEYCQMRIAEYSLRDPEALVSHRRAVDGLVGQRLRQAGEYGPTEAELRHIVDRYFLSSHTDEALLLLGDTLLEKADFSGARHAWEQISPYFRVGVAAADEPQAPLGVPWWMLMTQLDRDAKSSDPKIMNSGIAWEGWESRLQRASTQSNHRTFPDSKIELSELRARMAIAAILEQSDERARTELAMVQRFHPTAKGTLAGEEELWTTHLTQLRSKPRSALPELDEWPTWSKAISRSGKALPATQLGERPLWTCELPAIRVPEGETGSGRPRAGESNTAALTVHPLIVRGLALFADPKGVHALELRQGMPAWSGAERAGLVFPVEEVPSRERSRPSVGLARFTLHVAGDQLFAKMVPRLGQRASGPTGRTADRRRPQSKTQDDPPAESPALRFLAEKSYLVGLDLLGQGRLLHRWQLPAPEYDEQWTFEGTPITDDDHLYVGLSRRDTVRSEAHVACFDANSGKLLWRRFVVAAESPRNAPGQILGHNLLTLDHGILYYNTQRGAVAAISAVDGQVRWICRYPRSDFSTDDPDRSDRFLYRELTPCLFHRGQLFVAPADSDRVFSLEAATGELLWATDGEHGLDIVHLLGVAGDWLVASGDYVYWFDTLSGKLETQFPEPRKEAPGFPLPSPRGYGRGILVGDRVWFPTRDRIFVFDLPAHGSDEGLFRRNRVAIPLQEFDLNERQATGGNLVLAQGVLLIAGADKLFAFATSP